MVKEKVSASLETYVEKASKHVVLAPYWGGGLGDLSRTNILISIDLIQGGWRVGK